MPRIRFLADFIHETRGYQDGPRFSVGQTVAASDLKSILDLDAEPSAEWADGWMRRWVEQGVAEWASPKLSVQLADHVATAGAMTEAEARLLEDLNAAADEPQKKRGRPAGSKNKPKAED